MPQLNGDCGTPSGTPQPVCGVWGDCANRPGVFGTSNRSVGTSGMSNRSSGVYGRSGASAGVFGTSAQDRGVLGYGPRIGVHGICDTAGSDTDPTVYAGVYGQGADLGVYCVGALGLHSEPSA